MEITIRPTADLLTLGVGRFRVWKGKTAGGVPVCALVLYVRCDDRADDERFLKEAEEDNRLIVVSGPSGLIRS